MPKPSNDELLINEKIACLRTWILCFIADKFPVIDECTDDEMALLERMIDKKIRLALEDFKQDAGPHLIHTTENDNTPTIDF